MKPSKKLFRQILERIHRSLKAETFPGASNALFGGVSDILIDYLDDLEEDLQRANSDILHRTYISEILMGGLLALMAGLGISLVVTFTYSPPIVFGLLLILLLPWVLALIVTAFMYVYPSWKARNRARDINRNLPFALNHMSAIAGSGVPPSSLFELLVKFEEYGEIATEADEMVTRVKVFGDDATTALRDVAQMTPSDDLREVFYGMVSTMETGGSLKDFLDERSDRALFNYRMRREKEIDRLSTFASFYTALLVAAPLFLVTILAVLETIGGGLFGYPIKSRCGFIGALMGQCPMGVIDVGAFIAIPIANILFIIVLEVTQPEI
ncbi:MAG: type II secretion system F family protein [Candidatus Nanohaloarchaeota archaeon QJJ-7]|nr:type II secretion system F family protein [Candidatus Nanohaloarchaeota archaeon QJJ-7]